MQADKNPNVRRNDIRADMRPFEKAVNIDEAKILKPERRNVRVNIFQPSSIILFTSLPSRTKIPVMASSKTILRKNQSMELRTMDMRLIFIVFLRAAVSWRP